MRVLIHSDEYYPTPQACAYRMMVIADALVNRGHDVTVIASSTNKGNGKIDERKENIVYAPAIKMRKKTSLMRLLNNISFGISSIVYSIKLPSMDVVITTSPPPLVSIPGLIIAKIKGAKLVYDVRDIWPDVALEMGSFKKGSFFFKVFTLIVDFMYKKSDIITTVSPSKVQNILGHLVKQINCNSNDKVKLVSNGFDENVLFNNIDTDIIKKYQLDDYFTCVYIGNIGLAQGLGTLLDAAKQINNKKIRFLVFGTGAEKKILEQRVIDENIDNVVFCGVIPHEKVFTVLSKAKLSFIPLKNANMKDSIPTKIYEALGIGCPVLLLAEGDSCAIVKESRLGECISPNEIQKIPDMINYMFNNYEKYEHNKMFSKKLMADKYSRQSIAKDFVVYLENNI